MIIIYSWPFLTGVGVIEKNGGVMYDRLVTLPNFYFASAKQINEEAGEFRILLMPGRFWGTFEWENSDGIVGPDLLTKLLKKPVVQKWQNTTAFRYSGYIASTVMRSYQFRLLPLLNTKYIIIREDIPLRYYKEDSPEIIRREIMPFVNNTPPTVRGPLEIYRVDDKYFLPRIYVCD